MNNINFAQTALRPSFVDFLSRTNGKPITAVEIGVSQGFNSALMLTMCPNLKLYSVDHYVDMFHIWDGSGEFTEEKKINYKIFAINLLTPFGDRCKQIFEPSMEAVKYFLNESLDYIYIDGDHRYEPVCNDLKYWYPKLKIGGVFAGHDYVPDCLGVINAVNEFYEKLGLEFNTAPNGDFWSIKEK